MTVRVVRRAALVGLVTLTALGPSAAWAGDGGLELSSDGTRWATTLDRPLFDGAARVVPGGRASSQLWVRNAGPSEATVTVVVRGARSTMPAAVAAADDFRVRVGGTTGTGQQLAGCRLMATHVLGVGEERRIPVEVSLPATSGNVSQRQSIQLPVTVHLTGGRVEDPQPCQEDSVGPGPNTPPAAPTTAPTAGATPAAAPPAARREAPGPPTTPSRVQTDGGPITAEAVVPTSLFLLLLVLVVALLRRRRREEEAVSGPAPAR